MMTKDDYETLASALRPGLLYPERIKVFRLLVPHLLADNGKFNPTMFGESMGISQNVVKAVLTQKEVTQDGRQEVSSTSEEGGQEDCTCGEFAGSSVYYQDCPVHARQEVG